MIAAALVAPLATLAGTNAVYNGKCRHATAGTLKYENRCDITIAPETAEGKVIVYTWTPPTGGDTVVVRMFRTGAATVNGTPAKTHPTLDGTFHLVTSEKDDYRFSKPPPNLAL